MQFIIRAALIAVSFCAAALLLQRCSSDDGKPRVLIFNKSEFYVHECMPAAVKALQQLCEENGWHADVSDDADLFTEKKLSRYAAVVFLNTAGDVLNPTQEGEFERYIQAGGGFVGIHTAIDTEHNWKWYGSLVGGRFDGLADVQEATIRVVDRENPATSHLKDTWQHRDEWFNLTGLAPDLNILLTVDESTYTGGKMGLTHPVAWYHDYDGGRAFFTALGHTPESYSEPEFLQHLRGGLQYAIGKNAPLVFKERRVQAVTNTTGFIKTSLVCDLYEPMEMDMFADGKIIFIERRGTIKVYDPTANTTKVAGTLPVYIMNEEGLLGLAIDPKWDQNHWIYLYYSPDDDKESSIRLSRFVFKDDSLYRNTEVVLLKVATDRTVHNFHAAGCIEFDDEGTLYLSTGDNTDHYDDGYSSLDERPGKSQYDSQKSASNSMDLRGKILRIKPLPDGSYICPAGNLFTGQDLKVIPGGQLLLTDPLLQGFIGPVPSRPVASIDTAYVHNAGKPVAGNGQPEIFVMGVRNPFRFDYDDRRRLLIWGEPGPDAGVDDSLRGPEGYDEINIARTAGFYGWPYFVGNNRAYRNYDYVADKTGPYYDPLHPENESPNNTGERFLPPARPAFVWYPFKSTPDFPLVANGTRCAMAGPTYYCDRYPAETRFPDAFDGKVIIYEWMRNWMLALSIDSLDHYAGMQTIAPSIRLARPIDMLIDKNGSLWVLEYGTEWYASNPDACLSRIDYKPGDGSSEPVAEAGNHAPTVRWDFGAKNRSFYQPGDVIQYQIQVSDPEDGSLADGRIQAGDVAYTIDYFESAARLSQLNKKIKPEPAPFEQGKKLVGESDCKACHATDRKINGPAYHDIAGKYKGDKTALATLTQKIIKGGSGIWGQTAMSAHPQLAPKDVGEMVRWILSLSEYQAPKMQGAYTLTPPAGKSAGSPDGVFVFHAVYNDQGGPNEPALTGSETVVLRPTLQQAEQADSLSKSVRTYKRPLNNTTTTLVELKNRDCLVYRKIDLRGIVSVSLAADIASARQHTGGGRIELHLDSPDGRLAGSAAVPAANSAGGLSEVVVPIDKAAWPGDGALHDLFVVVVQEQAGANPVLGVDWLRFGF